MEQRVSVALVTSREVVNGREGCDTTEEKHVEETEQRITVKGDQRSYW